MEFRREAGSPARLHPERSVQAIAKELGVSGQTLRDWVKRAEIDRGSRHGLTAAKAAAVDLDDQQAPATLIAGWNARGDVARP